MWIEFDTIHQMTRLVRALPDIADRQARVAAYAAANIDPADIARLDRYAAQAESERRRLFPEKAPKAPQKESRL